MLRSVTWRSWAWLAGLAGLYGAAGFWLSGDGTVEEWLYRAGLLAATVAPLLFVAVYTVLGWRGAAKWWTNPIGTALVQAALTLVPIAGPLAYVFWCQGGMLRSSWLAWVEVSGPVVSALAWLRLCVLWVRLRHAGRLPRNGQSGQEDPDGTG